MPTPIGEHNPDWAIVWEPRDAHGQPTGEPLLYLVRGTKATSDLGQLRPDEARKIRCGERHFRDALSVDYEVVASAEQLPKRTAPWILILRYPIPTLPPRLPVAQPDAPHAGIAPSGSQASQLAPWYAT